MALLLSNQSWSNLLDSLRKNKNESVPLSLGPANNRTKKWWKHFFVGLPTQLNWQEGDSENFKSEKKILISHCMGIFLNPE